MITKPSRGPALAKRSSVEVGVAVLPCITDTFGRPLNRLAASLWAFRVTAKTWNDGSELADSRDTTAVPCLPVDKSTSTLSGVEVGIFLVRYR